MGGHLRKALIVFDYTISWIIIIGILLIMVIIVIFVTCDIDFTLLNFYNVGGILSGVFAGLAFSGVVFSLYNQYRQSRKQQQNFVKQLRIAKDQFTQQIKYDEIRRFQDTFFKMISLQLDIVNGLEYSDLESNNKSRENSLRTGRQVFKSIFIDKRLIVLDNDELNRTPLVNEKAFTIGRYYGIQEVLDKNGLKNYHKIDFIGIFDHYFRNLYRIIKFVHEQKNDILNDTDKYNYIANNVRSTLSEYELILLFYNCLTKAGYEKFKPLIERYTLFKNIRQDYFTKNDDIYSNKRIYINFPLNKFEEYLDIDNLNIVDEYKYPRIQQNVVKYKLQAFYKEKEVLKWQQYYLDIRDNKLSREDAYTKNFGEY